MIHPSVFFQVERWCLRQGEFVPIDQEDMRLCSAHAVASRMSEINAIREYRPRPPLGGQWAALKVARAIGVQELLERAVPLPVRSRIVEVTMLRRVRD